MFDLSLYDDDFFAWHKKYVHESELECGKLLTDLWNPRTLGDFGCGIGSFLQGAKEKEVLVQGFEIGGNHAEKYTHDDIKEHIEFNRDISKEMYSGHYEITLCIEVAEHIEEKNAWQLVSNLAWATNKICVFTAAPPGQDGTGHINLQPQSYWKNLFKKHGLNYNKNLTEDLLKVWEGIAPDYITKNLMVFK